MSENRFPLDRLGASLGSTREELRIADSPFAAAADAGFDNDPKTVAAWLHDVEERCRARDYIGGDASDPAVTTVYVEMNRFEDNTDKWYADAFACADPPAPGGKVHISIDFDAVVGRFLNDVRGPSLTLTGMEPVQALFDEHYSERSSEAATCQAVDLVRLSFYGVLDAASRVPRPRPLRVAAAVHDEHYFAVWEREDVPVV